MIPTPVELLGDNLDAGVVEKYLEQIEKQMLERKDRNMSLCISVPPDENYAIQIVRDCLELKGWEVLTTGMGINKGRSDTHIEFIVRPAKPLVKK